MIAARRSRSAGLAARLAGKRVLVCVGAGGVGKTTTSATLALGLAREGRKVAVVTIDPVALRGAGVAGRGELWAMMLDTKRTFDDVVTRLASDEGAREEILANPIYRELSTAVAGSQELSAVAKLYELYEEHDFEVIVLDTPPSRNALDFLEAPGRLLGFFEGRALQVFLAPSGLTARLFGRGTALVFSIFARVTGVNMLNELSRFFRTMSSVIDGFGQRTRDVEALLRAPETSFVIVTSPEPDPVSEAVFLARRLRDARMSADGLVVNRTHLDGLGGHAPDEVAELLSGELGAQLAERLAANLADFDVLARRDRESIAHLSSELEGAALVVVPQLDEDVQDLLGLGRVAEYLLE